MVTSVMVVIEMMGKIKEVVNNTPSERNITCIITPGWDTNSGP